MIVNDLGMVFASVVIDSTQKMLRNLDPLSLEISLGGNSVGPDVCLFVGLAALLLL